MDGGLKNLKKPDEQLLVPAERERKMQITLDDFASRFGLKLTEREMDLATNVARDRTLTTKETDAIARAICYTSMIRNGDLDGALKRFNFMATDPEVKEKYGSDFGQIVLAEMKKLDKGAAEELSARLTKGKEKVALRD